MATHSAVRYPVQRTLRHANSAVRDPVHRTLCHANCDILPCSVLYIVHYAMQIPLCCLLFLEVSSRYAVQDDQDQCSVPTMNLRYSTHGIDLLFLSYTHTYCYVHIYTVITDQGRRQLLWTPGWLLASHSLCFPRTQMAPAESLALFASKVSLLIMLPWDPNGSSRESCSMLIMLLREPSGSSWGPNSLHL